MVCTNKSRITIKVEKNTFLDPVSNKLLTPMFLAPVQRIKILILLKDCDAYLEKKLRLNKNK